MISEQEQSLSRKRQAVVTMYDEVLWAAKKRNTVIFSNEDLQSQLQCTR
jgi:hypothetical protein